jgi:hypothetical protein
MKMTIAFLLVATLLLGITDCARSETVDINATEAALAWQPLQITIPLRISVGTRALHVKLLDDTKGRQNENSFIGSIYKIEADQDYGQIRPYVQFEAPAGPVDVGIGVSYDAFDVATADSGAGDGDIELRCWLFYVTVAWPNQTRFKPFGEIGLFYSENNFDPLPSWSADGLREFDLENEQSIYFAGGCEISIYENWSLNIYARYTDFHLHGTYIFRGDDREPTPFYFTLEHVAYGLGAQYRF